MTLTNPGAISNSGAKKFTNQFGSVAKINWNRQRNDDEYQAYQNFTWYALHRTKKHQPYCGDCTDSSSSSSSSTHVKSSKKEKKVKKDIKKVEKDVKKVEKDVKKVEKDVKKKTKKSKKEDKPKSNPIWNWFKRFF